MDTTVNKTRRRSERVFLRVPLQAAGKAKDGRKFHETCETVVVNSHGALVYLQHDVEAGAILVLTNRAIQEDQECRVVYLGDASDHGQRVGVEFLTPAPHFWGLDFEPRPDSDSAS